MVTVIVTKVVRIALDGLPFNQSNHVSPYQLSNNKSRYIRYSFTHNFVCFLGHITFSSGFVFSISTKILPILVDLTQNRHFSPPA